MYIHSLPAATQAALTDQYMFEDNTNTTRFATVQMLVNLFQTLSLTWAGIHQFNNKVGFGTVPTYGSHQLGGGERLQALATPAAPTSITQTGAAGAVQYYYWIVAVDVSGGKTLVGPSLSNALANATLSGTNYNNIFWIAVPGAASYDILRTTTNVAPSGTVSVLVGNTTALTIKDQANALSAYTVQTRNNTADSITDGRMSSSGLTVSTSNGSQLNNLVVYSQLITPAAVVANTIAEQTFTVAGLAVGDIVFVNSQAAETAGIIRGAARVTAANTLGITFQNNTAGSLTPNANTNLIMAIR